MSVTQEEEVRSRVTDKLDEGFLEERSFFGGGSQNVKHRMERETNGDGKDLN